MGRRTLARQRIVLWVLVVWVCLSFASWMEMNYVYLRPRRSGWYGLRKAVLESGVEYGSVGLGGSVPYSEEFNFGAYGRYGDSPFTDRFSAWVGSPGENPYYWAPEDPTKLSKMVTVGQRTVQVQLDAGGDGDTERTAGRAEARWETLEPAIRRFLEKPTYVPSLGLFRNDYAAFHSLMGLPHTMPLEDYLVPLYLSFWIGFVPSHLAAFILLLIPGGRWAAHVACGVMMGLLLGSAIWTEIRYRRSRSPGP